MLHNTAVNTLATETTEIMDLTYDIVRKAMLSAQGLINAPEHQAGKEDILKLIERMGYLQIDTIQAVRRTQYLVLWSRLGDYDPAWLDELHDEGALFEYFAHALCYIPITSYPIYRRLMLAGNHTHRGWGNWAEKFSGLIEQVYQEVKARGPVSSSDFEKGIVISTGWGDLKHEKIALEYLFASGALMVPYRRKFKRFYDLQERVLPDWDDSQAYDLKLALKAQITRAVYALGVARENWIAQYYRLKKNGLGEMLSALTAEGHLVAIRVDGSEDPFYVHRERMGMVEAVMSGEQMPTLTTFLSPFDPLVSDRDRALELFGFDYRMESYTPAKDRIYGYFCLPILHRGHLVGRLDPKLHRREKRMEIKKIFIESGVEIDESLVESLRSTLARFASWHGAKTIEITATNPPDLRKAII